MSTKITIWTSTRTHPRVEENAWFIIRRGLYGNTLAKRTEKHGIFYLFFGLDVGTELEISSYCGYCGELFGEIVICNDKPTDVSNVMYKEKIICSKCSKSKNVIGQKQDYLKLINETYNDMKKFKKMTSKQSCTE